MDVRPYLKTKAARVDRALLAALPKAARGPKTLIEAMRYAVIGGGKRIRPVLTIAACEAVGGKEADAMDAALAIELIHSYSLVHDDLPCMDNDLMRRGKPSCHARYGEVTALLAGDALLTLAFEVLSRGKASSVSGWVADAAGYRGMVGGQALDMELQGQKRPIDLPHLEFINMNKTGELIGLSVRAGAFLGGASKAKVEALHRYGRSIGLLFQVVDDIIDGQGYVKLLGTTQTRELSLRLLERAKRSLASLGTRGRILEGIAELIAHRTE